MSLWRRWKKKHWDEQSYEGEVGPGYVFMPGVHTPRFRSLVMRLLRQAEENPLGALAVLAGILGSVAAIIALLK